MLLLFPVGFLFSDYLQEYKQKKLYSKYQLNIKEIILKTLRGLSVDVDICDIKLTIYKRKEIFCNIKITLKKINDKRYLKDKLEKELLFQYPKIKPIIYLHPKEKIHENPKM